MVSRCCPTFNDGTKLGTDWIHPWIRWGRLWSLPLFSICNHCSTVVAASFKLAYDLWTPIAIKVLPRLKVSIRIVSGTYPGSLRVRLNIWYYGLDRIGSRRTCRDVTRQVEFGLYPSNIQYWNLKSVAACYQNCQQKFYFPFPVNVPL